MIKDTLLKMLDVPGPSGFESACADMIEQEIRPFVDEIYRDVMGNLICVKKGPGKKVMVSAHMDEIGYIVTGIEDEGFLRITNIGGIYADLMPGTHVVLKSGAQGVLFREGGHSGALSMDKLFIDIGASTKAEALEKAAIGDWAVARPQVSVMGNRISSPYLDDRAGCAVLLESIKNLKKTDAQVYAVFSTQEELGVRGATTAAYDIDPDYGMAIDVTIADDFPMAKKKVLTTALGKGAAIKIMDRGSISHPIIKNAMEDAAKKANVPYQFEVLTGGATDAMAIHLTRSGVPSGTLSIPCRYVHAPCETVDLGDMDACVKLLTQYLEDVK